MADTTGYSYELTSSEWGATLKGGAEVKLSFNEDTALLSLQNGDLKSEIKGNTLELKYGEHTITLEKVK